MRHIWIIGVNLDYSHGDQSNLFHSILAINDLCDRRQVHMRLRESIVSLDNMAGATRENLWAWKAEHMADSAVVMLARGSRITAGGSHFYRMGILTADVLDGLYDDSDGCRMLFGYHLRSCSLHQARGRLLHAAGHAIGYSHHDGSFMNPEAFNRYPRGVTPPRI